MEAEISKSTNHGKSFKFSNFFDPANLILTAAVIIALIFLVVLSRENAQLKERGTEFVGSIAGSQRAEIGDIVPSFSPVNLEGQQTEIKYDGSKSIFYIFSPLIVASVSSSSPSGLVLPLRLIRRTIPSIAFRLILKLNEIILQE
jgi:hypothetical protein